MSVAANIPKATAAPRPKIGRSRPRGQDIAKSYGAIHALKGVNFDIHRGQVTTLFGENGAGKSTLMKILSGVIQPTSGEIILDGKPVAFGSTAEATRSRHLDHPPGAQPRAEPQRPRQHLHGPRDPRRHRRQLRRGGATGPAR